MNYSIAENIKRLKDSIKEICLKSGRDVNQVKLIAVTKTIDTDKIKQAVEAGLETFGENYVQEAIKKIKALPDTIHWHFIGNIQKNKVKYLIKTFELIHSVGSVDVAIEIDKKAMQKGIKQPILFEINLGGESTKSGFSPQQFLSLIERLNMLKNIQPLGLMTMPPPINDEIMLSKYFSSLREMRDKLISDKIFDNSFKDLSMGTTADYKIAIKEGATMIRIGTAIFGPRRLHG